MPTRRPAPRPRLDSAAAAAESAGVNLLVIGASAGTGARVVASALERGHHVAAFARSPQKLTLASERLTRIAGDFHDRAAVDAAVRGRDAVIITASATTLRAFRDNPHYFSQGTGYVIDAMKAHGVRRLVILSAIGTGDSRGLVNAFVRAVVIGWILKLPFADHERQEELTRTSGLDWVIARPGRLTNGAARGRTVKTAALTPVPSSISRADLADFLVEAADSDRWLHQSVQLGG
jgi:uncharacterized protein YbjT (DUF2867 family)